MLCCIQVPRMDIDAAYEAKEELSTAISRELAEALAPFGFTVNNVLCTERLWL